MLGFDVGTTQSKVACVDPTGKPIIVSNARGEPRTPSVLHYAKSGKPLVGLDAIEQGYIEPEGAVRNFKLQLGLTENLLHNGRVITPTDATTDLVASLKADAERLLNITVTECVVTCPANFKDDGKQAILESFERNNIKVLLLAAEPTAAGYAYAMDKPGNRMTLAVYDFGGGTFDASVLRVDGDQIAVLATEGVPHLGGNDLNECLRQRLLGAVKAKFGEEPNPDEDRLFYLDLEQRVEQAKISLGNRPEVPVVVPWRGNQLIEKVTQDEFRAAIAPMVQQSLDALDRAIVSAGLKISDVDRIIMAGGTSRSPYILQCLADHTGLVPRTDIDPEKVVAYGAALASVAELAKQGRTATLRGQVIPSPDVFVRDVTAHAVGCCVVDNSGPAKALKNAVIVPKNTPIPCQRTDHFYLENEDQAQAQIEILQGEPNADRDDCLLIGELFLDNLPKEPRRSERIQVEYVIDANGMVTATATDKVSGQRQTVSVDYKKGIEPKSKPAAA